MRIKLHSHHDAAGKVHRHLNVGVGVERVTIGYMTSLVIGERGISCRAGHDRILVGHLQCCYVADTSSGTPGMLQRCVEKITGVAAGVWGRVWEYSDTQIFSA